MWKTNKDANLWRLRSPQLSSDMLYNYLAEQGFTWGSQSSNWTLHTIWEPRVMSKLSFLTEMKPGEDIEKCNIWKVLREGFGTFRTNFDSLVDLSDNMIMVRIDCEACPKATELPSSQWLQGAQVSEFLMDNDLINFRCTPTTLVAGGGLREILKACLRYNDLLIAVGTVKRVEAPHARRLSLLNYDCDDADLTLIRVSFLPPLQGHDVKLLETITPADGQHTYKFKYRVRCGTFFEEISKFGVYDPNERTERDDRFLMEYMPIDCNANVTAIYRTIVERGINNSNGPATRPYHRVTFTPEDDDAAEEQEEESYRTSPIFTSGVPHFRGERHIRVPNVSDFWALVFVPLIIFLACGLMFYGIYSIGSAGSEEICYFSINHVPAPPIKAIVVKDMGTLSVIYEKSRFMWRTIVESFMRIVYWLFENLGYRYISERLFSNTARIHPSC
ncbi:uncharacterized protein LOC110863082 [Folsomia candida]|uniref:Uncharacterized protein n=1 Tax=Folsomia candida TaxID=158441 RepID=A0A226F5G1_FOLCA|nr:uncharacterized protein LOC110863082 [Folsomia candida]OXA65029.1 hypothetical protein Fcan01_03794 [Folsomia candida]